VNRPPDFHDLVGEEGSAEELARLERTHELLVAAGPPPEGPVPETPPVPGRVVPLRSRRRVWAEFAAVAAVVCLALGVGYLVGARENEFATTHVVAMHGLAPVGGASAELRLGSEDRHGNIPIRMRVDGLPRLPHAGWYELYLSKNGRPGASCGTFMTDGTNTTVTLSVGYDLADWHEAGVYDGWVITAHVPGNPAASRRVLLTT
jgi:hypothetical protein